MPGVADSLHHTNTVYCVTSREFSYNGSAQYRPKFRFKKLVLSYKRFLKNYKKAKETRINLLNCLRESKRVFNCWVACSFKLTINFNKLTIKSCVGKNVYTFKTVL